MCGIIGVMSAGQPVDVRQVERFRDRLAHRGPDGKGLWISPDRSLALGHRRLALVDLSPAGAQPMENEDGSLVLTMNGEIYNHKELRSELAALGHRFRSLSDSEVALHGFEQWGPAVLDRLEGMFAFGIWDERAKSLFLARDRFGIKPLYYYPGDRLFVFASELKAMTGFPGVPREMDLRSLCEFFTYRYVPSPGSIWKDIRKLPPAHYLRARPGRPPEVREYWRLRPGRNRPSPAEAAETVAGLLSRTVACHAAADVSVGAFLSGGYDSSSLVREMSRVEDPLYTFSLGFSGWEQSEHLYGGMVAERFGTKHADLVADGGSLSLLPELAQVYDEPIADISTIPTFLISRRAARDVKAVVSGEGADEQFCGYTWQREIRQAVDGLPFFLRPFVGRFPAFPDFFVSRYARAMAMGLFDDAWLRRLLTPDLHPHIPDDPFWFYRKNALPGLSPVKTFQAMDVKCFMAELVLVKVDRASMASSLEVRVPFLDRELFEYVFSLDESLCLRPGVTKPLLYELIKGDMPPEILARKKQGFVGPDSYYADLSWYRGQLEKSALVRDGIVSGKAVRDLIAEKEHWRLWKVLVFELWYKAWVTGDHAA